MLEASSLEGYCCSIGSTAFKFQIKEDAEAFSRWMQGLVKYADRTREAIDAVFDETTHPGDEASMQEWFCRKCNSRAMTQFSNPKCSVLDNGVIHRIDGQVCANCTEKTKQPVLMWPLSPPHEQLSNT